MRSPTDEELKAISAQHSGARLLSHKVEETELHMVARKLTRIEWKQFLSMLGDENRRVEAMDQIVREVRLWPDAGEFEQMLDEYPGVTMTFGSRITKLAGAGQDAIAKKL